MLAYLVTCIERKCLYPYPVPSTIALGSLGTTIMQILQHNNTNCTVKTLRGFKSISVHICDTVILNITKNNSIKFSVKKIEEKCIFRLHECLGLICYLSTHDEMSDNSLTILH